MLNDKNGKEIKLGSVVNGPGITLNRPIVGAVLGIVDKSLPEAERSIGVGVGTLDADITVGIVEVPKNEDGTLQDPAIVHEWARSGECEVIG